MLTVAVRIALVAIAIAAVAILLSPFFVDAASPKPSTGADGDPRSVGEGPGLAGDPVTAILAVLVIGLTSVVLTYGYILATRKVSPR